MEMLFLVICVLAIAYAISDWKLKIAFLKEWFNIIVKNIFRSWTNIPFLNKPISINNK